MITAMTTHDLMTADALAEDFVSAEHSIKTVLAASGMTRTVRSIFFSSPRLEEITNRLARRISHLYPSSESDVPLLQRAILAATAAYLAAVTTENRKELHDRAYLVALHQVALDFIKFQTYALWDEQKSEMWYPFRWNLIDWVKKVKPSRIGFLAREGKIEPYEHQAATMMLAATLLQYDRPADMCAIVEACVDAV